MGKSCSKNLNEDNRKSENNVRRPSDDAELLFLVALDKAKHCKGPEAETPGPSAPWLSKKQLRIKSSVKTYGKNLAPHNVHAWKAQTESINQLIWLRSVSLKDRIPGGSIHYVVRKIRLPDDRKQIQSLIDEIPEPKNVFAIREAQPTKPPKLEEVIDLMDISDLPIHGMRKTPATIQCTVSGQSESLAFKSTLPSQSEGRAMSKVAKRACWNAYIKQLMAQMGSKCIRERMRAIDRLVDDCTLRPDMVMSCAFSVFDIIRDRLVESNRKVNLHMLKALGTIIPQVKESLPKVIFVLIPAIVDNHLNSKSDAIYVTALAAVRSVVSNLDNSVLLEIFTTKAQLLGGRAKKDLAETVADMVMELFPRRPKMVEQQALPLLWHMLAVCSHSAATATLFRALYSHMGPRLWELAAFQPALIRKGLQHLLFSVD